MNLTSLRLCAAHNKKPDTAGTGRHPSLMEMVASLPNHIIYRPRSSGPRRVDLQQRHFLHPAAGTCAFGVTSSER
jgi:hypothetical protein